jgi:hypothetical protein
LKFMMWTLSNFCVVCFNYELFHGVHHHDVFAHDSGVLVRVSQQARRRFRMRSYAFLTTWHFPGGKRCLFPPQPHKLESFTIYHTPLTLHTVRANENALSHRINTSQKCKHNDSISASDSRQSSLFPSLNTTEI